MSLSRESQPASPSRHLTVVDVYDLASSIGKDFEKIIELHGNDSVRTIMPKVISALETLEALANKNERENEEIHRLQRIVEEFDKEKKEKMAIKLRFEEELEQAEENYRKEILELRQAVNGLMQKNRDLSSTMNSLPTNFDVAAYTRCDEDIQLMLELRESSNKQKEEIKQLQNDVHSYTCQVENLENNLEKLIHQNEELLRKNKSLQKQGRMIVEEKMEIIKRLERTEESNIQLSKLLNESDRACKDLQNMQQEDEPMFTLAELREVLQEKNVLKGRVMELEEEMDRLSSRESVPAQEIFDLADTKEKPPESNNDEDLPVYGPLPKEPKEKLYPWKYERNHSGVRKFFQFFKDFSGGSAE